MTLIDTGPLVALIDSRDHNHARCREALQDGKLPLLITVACLTEAMYLLDRAAGLAGKKAIWDYIQDGVLRVADSAGDHIELARQYMDRFQDVPCDFADATVLALADRLSERTIFTLDGHFHAYRVGGQALIVRPGPRPAP